MKQHPVSKVEDRIVNWRSQLFAKRKTKALYKDPLDYKAVPFPELFSQIDFKFTPQTEKEWHLSCLLNGFQRTTKIYLHGEFDPARPSLIYHHGAGIFNYQPYLTWFLWGGLAKQFNVFAIRAQGHDKFKDLEEQLCQFENVQLMMAGSVRIVEEIINWINSQQTRPVVLTGFSLGGAVTAIHQFMFNSAQLYLPLAAHPNVGRAMFSKAIRDAVDQWPERVKNPTYAQAFDFRKMINKDSYKKIYPIYGQYDNTMDTKEMDKFWQGFKTTSFNTGHLSIMMTKGPTVRKLVRDKVRELGVS